jgi:phenylacetate-CoA ligase
MKVPYYKAPLMMYRLRQNYKRTLPELQRHQNKKLRAMVKHCADNVPYYHDLFKASNLDPSDIRTPDDLSKLPVLTKSILRANPVERFMARGVKKTQCIIGYTSGTSGQPLTLYYAKDAYFEAILLDILSNMRLGDSLFHRRVETSPWVPLLPSILQKLGIYHTQYISPLEEPTRQLQIIQDFQPKTLLALPSSALILAKELREHQIQNIDLKVVFTIGELVNKEMRAMIQETFNANLYDRYGTAEVGRVSWECHEHSYHLQPDMNIVEILRDGALCAPGEVGEIVVTQLTNYAMPMLRYNLEDQGMCLDESCSCECAYPLMRLTIGRMMDVITLPDGRQFSAHEVTVALHAWRYSLKQFQVIQPNRKELVVNLVPGEAFQPSIIQDIHLVLTKMLGSDLELQLSLVDAIPRERTGKFKAFKSRITPNKLIT